MKCEVCNSEIVEGTSFCGSCGSPVAGLGEAIEVLGIPGEDSAPIRQNMISRMIKAACFQVSTYEEVEADSTATVQAIMVVFLVALATGIGSVGNNGFQGLLIGIPVAIAGWAVWALVIYIIGTKLLPSHHTRSNWGELARTTGFAQAPGVLKVLGGVPVLGPVIIFVVSVWQLATMVIAVRQALDYESTMRAVLVVLLGFIPYMVLMGIILMPLYMSAAQ